MNISILHNCDHDLLEDDPGREARKDVVRVAVALCDALSQRNVSAEAVPVDGDLLEVAAKLRRRGPDLVINLCESLDADSRGEMALPCLLDLLGIPYTGSDALALGLSLHKNKAKEILLGRGVPTPQFAVIESVEDLLTPRVAALPFPLIVKPTREDASVGIDFSSVASDRAALGRAVVQVLRTFQQPALVEQFIDGREIYVPILGNQPRRALPLSEIHFGAAFDGLPHIVSYRAKWDASSEECIDSPSGPCALNAATEAQVVSTAMAAFEALGCRDYGRVDLRLSANGDPYVIDINPNCDLHPHAGYAKAATAAGIGYPDLAMHLVEIAVERSHGNSSSRRAGQGSTRRVAGPNRNVLAARGGLRPRAHRSRAQGQ